jgi:hypothetical membrane protein
MKDKLGIIASGLCLIHCVFFPIIFSILPIFSLELELFLIPISFFLGGVSIFDNLRKHKWLVSIILFIVGFLFLITGLITTEEIYHIVGIISIMVAHIANYLYIRKKDGCHPHKCDH